MTRIDTRTPDCCRLVFTRVDREQRSRIFPRNDLEDEARCPVSDLPDPHDGITSFIAMSFPPPAFMLVANLYVAVNTKDLFRRQVWNWFNILYRHLRRPPIGILLGPAEAFTCFTGSPHFTPPSSPNQSK